jgi:hypothetical protein
VRARVGVVRAVGFGEVGAEAGRVN